MHDHPEASEFQPKPNEANSMLQATSLITSKLELRLVFIVPSLPPSHALTAQ